MKEKSKNQQLVKAQTFANGCFVLNPDGFHDDGNATGPRVAWERGGLRIWVTLQ